MLTSTREGPAIYYELLGNQDAPVLALVRGLGRFALHWGAWLEQLAPHFRLLVLDNRGIGRSGAARTPFSVTAMSDDLARVLDHAQVARAHVFGMSLGGMVSLRFALDHGGRLDRLVLAATTAGGASAVRPRFTPFLAMARARLFSPERAAEADAKMVLGAEFVRENPELVHAWTKLAREYPVPPRTLVFQALAALGHDVSRELAKIGAPTLIVSAEHDRIVPAENSRILGRGIRRSRLEWLPGAAHDLTTEHTEPLARLVLEFLAAPLGSA